MEEMLQLASQLQIIPQNSPSTGCISTSLMHNLTHNTDPSVILKVVNKRFILLH